MSTPKLAFRQALRECRRPRAYAERKESYLQNWDGRSLTPSRRFCHLQQRYLSSKPRQLRWPSSGNLPLTTYYTTRIIANVSAREWLTCLPQQQSLRSFSKALRLYSFATSTTPPPSIESGRSAPEPALPCLLRRAMRLFPTPLTIVSVHPKNGAPHGMLVSSFATVTLEPVPYVSFNMRLPSRTYDAIVATEGLFSVSAVTDASVARWWAEQAPALMSGKSRNSSDSDTIAVTAKAQEIVTTMLGKTLDDGRCWALGCRMIEEMGTTVGDHRIVVAEVLSVHLRNAASEQHRRSVLLWREGKVRTLD